MTLAYQSMVMSNPINEEEYESFMSDKAFTVTIMVGDSIVVEEYIRDEYYLLEFADWTIDSRENLYEKEEVLQGKAKNIVVMKDGVIEQHHYEGQAEMQLSLKIIGKEEKEKIMETYKKWKEENENREKG